MFVDSEDTLAQTYVGFAMEHTRISSSPRNTNTKFYFDSHFVHISIVTKVRQT